MTAFIYVALTLFIISINNTFAFVLKSQNRKISSKSGDHKVICNLQSSDVILAAPILPRPKVPSSAWRWPPSWPFPADFVETTSNFTKSTVSNNAIDSMIKHLNKFIPKTSKVLELGVSEISIIHEVGSDLSKKLLLSDFLSVDDVESNFDDVVISSGVESISEPREFLKKVWRCIKPGGTCSICFFTLPPIEITQSLKMWTTMTNEQKVWIAGSYYHYSIPKGWPLIEGYDVLDDSVSSNQIIFGKSNETDSVFVVRAIKRKNPSIFNDTEIIEYIESSLNSYKNIIYEDLPYLSLRLLEKLKEYIRNNDFENLDCQLLKISEIYNVLKELKEDIIPKPIQAMIAVAITDKWNNSPSKVHALRTGLGLEKPDEVFWLPLQQLTSKTTAQTKIALLIALINNWENESIISQVPFVLQKILESLSLKELEIDEKELQSLATELMISELLMSNRKNPLERILRFLNSQSNSEIIKLAFASTRLNFN